MKKRIMLLLLSGMLACSMMACGKTTEEVWEVTEEVVEETEEVEEVVEEEEEEEETKEVASLMGYNMIEDGDFSEGQQLWYLYTSGGQAAISYVDEALVVDITGVGTVEHGVQIYYDGFSIETGCEYTLSFDATSTVAREVAARIQINGGDYHAYVEEFITMDGEMQHYEITFTMEETSDPAPRLCFNMGLCADGVGDVAHTITLDNFELYCTDESGRIIADDSLDTPIIEINQVGYLPDDTKTAVFIGKEVGSSFDVVDVSTGKTVYTGSITEPSKNRYTKQYEASGDFSAVTTAGTYKIVNDECGESYEFTIESGIYDDAYAATLKMLYYQRCGSALEEDQAGEFAHDACHTSLATIYGTSTTIDVSGGWHDAGDYGRYVVSGAKAVADLLLAYEKDPTAFGDDTDIPESGNGTADILDEARYELEWLLKMQASSGGVYHKVTCANFPDTVLAVEETAELIVCPISTTATGDFAAVMAMAARVYADVDASFASECLVAAQAAASYLDANGNAGSFYNPDGVVTGEYDDEDDTDERFWAYAELYKTTGEAKYETALTAIAVADVSQGLGWAQVGSYGSYAYLTSDYTDTAYAKSVQAALVAEADTALANAEKDTFGSSITEYIWGSNMCVANNGMLFIMVDELTGGSTYSLAAKKQVDYLLGCNANSYCFLTGFGTLSPEGTHHRPSQVLGITLEGMLVGGPDADLDDPYAIAVLSSNAAAKCYVDNSQSYSCNEITVYWNSPLVYLLAQYVD